MNNLDPDVFQVKLHLGAATDLIKTLNRLCQKKDIYNDVNPMSREYTRDRGTCVVSRHCSQPGGGKDRVFQNDFLPFFVFLQHQYQRLADLRCTIFV